MHVMLRQSDDREVDRGHAVQEDLSGHVCRDVGSQCLCLCTMHAYIYCLLSTGRIWMRSSAGHQHLVPQGKAWGVQTHMPQQGSA